MKRWITPLACSAILIVFASGCATKKFVREHVGAAETKIGQRVETQETRLQDTTQRTTANTQAIDAAGQRLQTLDGRIVTLDGRVGEVAGVAADAKREVGVVANNLKDTEAQLTQRIANRNNYSTMDTIVVYFDFNKADLKDDGFNELREVVKALKANPNVIVELQGFADPRGTDRYNNQLTRERVDAVIRHLVRDQGIDLRRIHAVGMGKVAPQAGEKQTNQSMAKARRVEIRLLAPQS